MDSMNELIDYLNYCSWKAQITLHGMTLEQAKSLYKNALKYEKMYENENATV